MRAILLNIILIVHVSLTAQNSVDYNLTRIFHNADFNYSGINNLNNLSADKWMDSVFNVIDGIYTVCLFVYDYKDKDMLEYDGSYSSVLNKNEFLYRKKIIVLAKLKGRKIVDAVLMNLFFSEWPFSAGLYRSTEVVRKRKSVNLKKFKFINLEMNSPLPLDNKNSYLRFNVKRPPIYYVYKYYEF